MSLLQNLFRRKKPEETPPAAAPETPVAPAPPPPDNVIYIYSHGFTNGVYRVSPDSDSFEKFLDYANQTDRIKEQRALNEKAIADLESKLAAATLSYAADTHLSVEKSNQAAHISISLSDLGQRRAKNEQKEEALTTQARETISEYPWAPALLFLSAGITFIVADISITQQITSWGFKMSGWQARIFAIGLAFTAFLIKPTVDRLLEKPFQAAGFKLKTLYKCVLLGLTALGLLILFCLGKFRSDAEMARNKLDEITAQMGLLNPNSQQSIDLQREYDAVQASLSDNTWGQYGLIFSGVLFAIGGAVCLSVAFGSLKQLITRYWLLPARMRWLKKEIRSQDRQIATLRSEHTALKTGQEQADKRLAAVGIPQLKEELSALRDERDALRAEFFQAEYGREHALYLDGKSKGERYEIDGKLQYKVSDDDHATINLGKEDTQAPPRAYTRRPFVKMRKMIADNFNKNQNTPSYDGTEFEIVS